MASAAYAFLEAMPTGPRRSHLRGMREMCNRAPRHNAPGGYRELQLAPSQARTYLAFLDYGRAARIFHRDPVIRLVGIERALTAQVKAPV